MSLVKGPPYPTKAVANLFLDWASDRSVPITPLKLQKLLFFCHADYLVKTGQPLVEDTFEAWSYGPVIPGVYHEFKDSAEQPIAKRAESFSPVTQRRATCTIDLDDTVRADLEPIFDIYVRVDGGLLSGISHRAGGPWDLALRQFDRSASINRRITNELIVENHRPRAS